MYKKNLSDNQPSGFILPTILLLSLALIAVALSLVQVTSSIQSSLASNYINKLAQEAADAGVTYANYCLNKNNGVQSWGPGNSTLYLHSYTDCSGLTPHSTGYFETVKNYRTQFTVPDLELNDAGAYIITSIGTVDTVANNGTKTIGTEYSVTRKYIVQSKTLKASFSASGVLKTCGIVSNVLYCWGQNDGEFAGQLGNGTTTTAAIPTPTPVVASPYLTGKTITDVSAGEHHVCAIADKRVYCWGRNMYGQLGNNVDANGDGIPDDSSVPVPVGAPLNGLDVVDIAVTGDSSCAIAVVGGSNKIYCWGSNTKGTLGLGNTLTNAYYATPQPVDTTNLGAGYSATKMATSGSYSRTMCANVSGKAYCWGDDSAGQIGDAKAPTSTPYRIPTKVLGALVNLPSGPLTVTSISQDGWNNPDGIYTHVCAVAYSTAPSDAQVYCWGENSSGQLGRGSGIYATTDTTKPVANVDFSTAPGFQAGTTYIKDVVAGIEHTCALSSAQIVYCWGSDGMGQLGDGDNTLANKPYPVPVAVLPGGLLNKQITSIAAGGNRGCAIADYRTYCWGLNNVGQLGDGTIKNSNIPVEATFLNPTREFLF